MSFKTAVTVNFNRALLAKVNVRAKQKGFHDCEKYLLDLCVEDIQFDPAIYEKLRHLITLLK